MNPGERRQKADGRDLDSCFARRDGIGHFILSAQRSCNADTKLPGEFSIDAYSPRHWRAKILASVTPGVSLRVSIVENASEILKVQALHWNSCLALQA